MCQIFAGKSNKIRATLLETAGLMASLFGRNKDGLGAMYATSKRVLRMPKVVPATLEEAIAFVRQLPDDERNLVLHFRMKTSGRIDHDNAHPFVVLPGQLAMTHNGILSISTKSDETMCDTRHYIRDYLRPMLEVAPQLTTVSAWRQIVGDDIGSNRFVFLDNDGNMSFINKHTGIEHDGMWIANTYSFDAGLLIPGHKKSSVWDDADYDDVMWPPRDGRWAHYGQGSYSGNVRALGGPKATTPSALAKDYGTVQSPNSRVAEEVWAALRICDTDAIATLLAQMPYTVFYLLYSECEFVPLAPEDGVVDIYPADEAIMKALADGDAAALRLMVMKSTLNAVAVAEAMCLKGDWVGKAINKKGDTYEVDLVKQAADEIEQQLAEIDDIQDELEALDIEQDELEADLKDIPETASWTEARAEIQEQLDAVEERRTELQDALDELAPVEAPAPEPEPEPAKPGFANAALAAVKEMVRNGLESVH